MTHLHRFVLGASSPWPRVRGGAVACLWGVLGALGGCGAAAPRPPGATPATLTAGRLPTGPSGPTRGLPIPDLQVPWEPPVVAGGDIEGLQTALSAHENVAIVTGESFDDVKVERLFAALHPTGRLAASTTLAVEDLLAPGTELPLDRIEGSTAVAPQYRTENVVLSREFRTRAGATAAEAVMVLDEAPVDETMWAPLPAHAVGSCEPAQSALAAGQEQSLAYLEPFLDHADAVLWQVYRTQLGMLVPRMTGELGAHAELKTRGQFDSNEAWEQYQCGHAYWEYLQNFVVCGERAASCPSAPRMYLMGGARIGSAEPSFFVEPRCPERIGRDYVLELRQVAREAAQVARDHLEPDWVVLADRLGTITDVATTLEDVCTPRRRRHTPADVEQARTRLARIGRTLASEDLQHERGRWEIEDDQFHVPGVGPVRQLARFEAGSTSAAQSVRTEAARLRQFVLARALCRSGHDPLPLVAMVVDVAHPRPTFLGYFLREELLCADLPPRGTASEQTDHGSDEVEPPLPSD